MVLTESSYWHILFGHDHCITIAVFCKNYRASIWANY
uniref:Uncharacterized protein n=1 Tax=Arundo donax TaxID=35708 RepID=A0A0A8ZRE9_ARUDO